MLRGHRSLILVLFGLASACASPGAGDTVSETSDAGETTGMTGEPTTGGAGEAGLDGLAVFDLDVLHRIELSVDDMGLVALEEQPDTWVKAELKFDGAAPLIVGVRKKGGIGSVQPLDGKPAFSVKTDAFVAGQELDGLRRLVLNNSVQDEGLLSEHLGYEVARRAGIPAPRTAHGVVALNGEARGIYVLKEPINKKFLRAAFGEQNGEGNLYEGSCPFDDPCTDFAVMPERMELKDEDDGRSNADIFAAAAAVRDTPDATWESAVRAALDLDQFVTAHAVEIAVAHWDGYSFNMNNYYMYHHPVTDRFVFLPHGMDSMFDDDGIGLDSEPAGLLAQRLREVVGIDVVADELARVRDQAWDVEALLDRIAAVEALVAGATEADGWGEGEQIGFEERVARIREFVEGRPASL